MSSNPKPLAVSPATATQPLTPEVTNSLYNALMSTSAIPNIQSVLTHELQASGWTTNLRNYITQLLRSGECTSYKEILDRVMQETKVGEGGGSNGLTNGVNGHKENGVNGEAKSVEEGGIRIPEKAVREGVKVIRRELEQICDIVVEGNEKH